MKGKFHLMSYIQVPQLPSDFMIFASYIAVGIAAIKLSFEMPLWNIFIIKQEALSAQ